MPAETGANWFHSWNEEEEAVGKSFHLQVELEGISHTASPYVKLSRSASGVRGPWKLIGETSVVSEEKDPAFSEGFRIMYEQHTNLSMEMVRAELWHRREGILPDERIGEASVSLTELLRTFGTKVKVELLKPKSEKIVGRVQFLGEKLPAVSPKGGKNSFEFRIRVETPPSDTISAGNGTFAVSRLFLVVSREREDGSWGMIHRTGYVRTGSTRMSQKLKAHRKSYLRVPRFTLNQTEMLLGESPKRPIRMQLLMHARKDDTHSIIGSSILTVDELLNDLTSETSVDLTLNDEIIGEFAVLERDITSEKPGATSYSFEVEINRFDEEEEAKEFRKAQRKRHINLNSP